MSVSVLGQRLSIKSEELLINTLGKLSYFTAVAKTTKESQWSEIGWLAQ